MSLLKSRIIRCLCISLAGAFLFISWVLDIRAWQALSPGEEHFPFSWDDEISGAIFLLWLALVVFYFLRRWRVPLAEIYEPALRAALIQHILIFFLAALMLDGGLMLLSCFLAGAIFWMVVGVILSRRPTTPTTFDLAVISNAFLLLSFFVTCIAFFVPGIIMFH